MRTPLFRFGAIALLAAGCASSDTSPESAQPTALSLSVAPSETVGSGSPLAIQPVAQLVDADGHAVPFPGRSVTVLLTSGAATLFGTTTVKTNTSGRAKFTDLVVTGVPGELVMLSFSSPGLAGATAHVSLITGAANKIVVVSGSGQVAPAGTTLNAQLIARVVDRGGNPVANIPVAFSVSVGGGTIQGGARTSDASGLVTLDSWVLGPVPGSNRVRAASAGLVSADFLATGSFFAKYLAMGWNHSCVLISSDLAYCWGRNAVGALGTGNTTGPVPCWQFAPIGCSTIPAPVVGGFTFQTLISGYDFTCGIRLGLPSLCWGDNRWGRFGNGSSTPGCSEPESSTCQPSPIPGILGLQPTAAFSLGTGGCALSSAGAASCWGVNQYGALGIGRKDGPENCTDVFANNYTCSTSPVSVAGGISFVRLTGSNGHACGLTAAGLAYCWGFNGSGELGNNTFTEQLTPVPVVGGLTFREIAASPSHTCALTTAGLAYCWGSNSYGKLGIGDTTVTMSSHPMPVLSGIAFTSIVSGWDHNCGLSAGGQAYCWGANGYWYIVLDGSGTMVYEGDGRLGDGSTEQRNSPVQVLGGLSFTQLSAGNTGNCALTAEGRIYCWGRYPGRSPDGTVLPPTTSPHLIATP